MNRDCHDFGSKLGLNGEPCLLSVKPMTMADDDRGGFHMGIHFLFSNYPSLSRSCTNYISNTIQILALFTLSAALDISSPTS